MLYMYTQFQTKLFHFAVIYIFVIVSFSFGTQVDLSENTGLFFSLEYTYVAKYSVSESSYFFPVQ